MAKPFSEMSVDELIEYKVKRKQEIRDIQADLNEAHQAYTAKVNRERLEDKIKAAGLEGLVVIPGAAQLSSSQESAEVN